MVGVVGGVSVEAKGRVAYALATQEKKGVKATVQTLSAQTGFSTAHTRNTLTALAVDGLVEATDGVARRGRGGQRTYHLTGAGRDFARASAPKAAPFRPEVAPAPAPAPLPPEAFDEPTFPPRQKMAALSAKMGAGKTGLLTLQMILAAAETTNDEDVRRDLLALMAKVATKG